MHRGQIYQEIFEFLKKVINDGDNLHFWDEGCEIICFFLASGTSLPKKLERELYGDNHTTYPSLVIAFGFGLLFLCAAVVLIGRPWWFAFHRPRYSKVDYLMNGL